MSQSTTRTEVRDDGRRASESTCRTKSMVTLGIPVAGSRSLLGGVKTATSPT
jgi:hypothetical protein